MKMLIATHNMKKRDELQRILSPLGIDVVTADDINCTLREVEENGTTFEENALIKAKAGCEDSGLPCIADDSGICVDALGGAPGIYSARYSGGDDEDNNDLILKNLENTPDEERTARYVCAIYCVFPDGKQITVRGECEGVILRERVGTGGFGYDPIFKCGDKYFGLTSAEEKDAISHRGKALRLLCEELKDIV